VLYTKPTDFGEPVLLWCRAGITAHDLVAAQDIIQAACWARDVRVVTNERHGHIVVLEVIRRDAPTSTMPSPDDGPSWPYSPRTEADELDPDEPGTSRPSHAPPPLVAG
jgi:hypothetical protein